METGKRQARRGGSAGYALLDVALALTIFAFSVTSLVVLLQRTVETSAANARDRLVQAGIESFLVETRRKPVREMNSEFFDENLEVTYRAVVEPLGLSNVDGEALQDLYQLTITAEFEDDGGLQEEEAQVYIYQPEKR